MNELVNLTSVSINPVYVYITALVSARSRHAMFSGLRSTLALVRNTTPEQISDDQVYSFPWHQLEYQHLQAIRSKFIEAEYAPATINNYLAAIRGVLKQAWKLGLLTTETYDRLMEIESVKENRLPAGRYVSPEEIQAAFYVALSDKNKKKGIRDAAVLVLLYGVGCRREEAVNLTWSSFTPGYTMVTIFGKGRKERKVPVPAFVRRYLHGWEAVCGKREWDAPFFVRLFKDGSPGRYHLTTTTIWNIVVERFKEAGLESVSPHSFRRSMATNYLDQGENEGTVAGIGGWSSTDLVQRYNRHKEKQMQNAAERLNLDI